MKKLILFILSLTLLMIYMSTKNSPDSKSFPKENRSYERVDLKFDLTQDSPFDLSVSSVQHDRSNEVKSNETSDWYSTAMSNIQKNEYDVTYNNESNTYQSPNRANNMRFIYNKRGFIAKLRSNKIPLFDESDKMIEEIDKKYKYLDDWKVDFDLQSVSKDLKSDLRNDYLDFNEIELSAGGNKIFIENENLRIQYSNDENGMRQDFIVKNKPVGNDRLRLIINADTKLKMLTGGDALKFKDEKGDIKLQYASLKVWDANGKELRAYFEKNYELGITNYELKDKSDSKVIHNSFLIVVNDEDAAYPVTIDPLSSTAAWTAEINQANANFGWSVATAGDVNDDGYSDVIVGAPYYDNGQTDEGSVFVYHGSINGLSLSANWTMESNQSSALFGWSVATAGDVNGDGYSDVIIGSPTYDSVQTDEGRAYVYYGSVSGLQAVHAWKYETNQAGENFGYSLACAGDVNNDGYSDVVIGSPFYDNGQTNEGRVYVFKGSTGGLPVTADWTYEMNTLDTYLGFSVATAGDINGDNFSDITIGAPRYDIGLPDYGRVYIFHSNGNTFPATPTTTRTGLQTGENFGYSVSTAGDVNGDGYSDIMIGAPLYTNGQVDEGRCYCYLGSSSGIGAAAVWTQESNEISGQFGISVSTAGDLNADGFADVILGGNYLDNGQTDEGRAFVYLGYSGGLSSGSAIIYESNQSNSRFGISVATAGDINGDGFSDVIVGSHMFDSPSANEGRAFVFLGSAIGMSSAFVWSSESNQSNSDFGFSVSSAGDVNGDGYSDVIVGARRFDNGQTDEGAAFVYHGSASGLSSFSNWSLEGNQVNAYFGTSVSSAGDVNGDGYSDVIVGAPYFDNGFTDEGAAFVYHGSASGLSATAGWSGESNQESALFGLSVSGAGDVNGDGYSDLIVGARDFDNGQTDEGAAFVYHGSGSGISLSFSWSSEINQANSQYGFSVSSAGDVNGDGYSDVIVGANNYYNGISGEGAAFVHYGSVSGLSLSSDWSVESNQANSNFGFSVSSAGDVNGDGYSDVIIGANLYDNGHTNEGRAFVYNGSASGLSTIISWNAESNQANSNFGNSVSSAGDVNGDGYSDVIVGAPFYDYNLENEGRVYVYHGSAAGLSSATNWTAESIIAFANLGYSVSSAGDVNGDGYSDVITGAATFSNGQINEGSAFVYYGGNGISEALRSTVNQYKYGTSDIVSSDGITGSNGKVRISHFAKSPFGKATVRLVSDIQQNGIPFTGGSKITNSVSYNSVSSFKNLGLTGSDFTYDITGLNSEKQYKWRTRLQYTMTAYPFQKFGPWRYYNNFSSESQGGFRPKSNDVNLNLTMLIQGFYDSSSDFMVQDTARVYLRNSSPPYAITDSAISILSNTGAGTFLLSNAVNGTGYYIQLQHRNSIETWSKTAQQFTSSELSYNFSTVNTQAYGDNLIQADNAPVVYAVYSGDVNQDGVIDIADGSLIDNDALNFNSGYLPTDVNGDDIVDVADAVYADNNGFNFVGAITP